MNTFCEINQDVDMQLGRPPRVDEEEEARVEGFLAHTKPQPPTTLQ